MREHTGMRSRDRFSILIFVVFSVCISRQSISAPGDLDHSFGSSGIVNTIVGENTSRAEAIALTKDGKILVAGVCDGVDTNRDFAIVRYNFNGAIDSTFGNSGIVTLDFDSGIDRANAVALTNDNKIIVAGYADLGMVAHAALARLNADGSLDTSFGNNGVMTTHTGTSQTYVSAIAVDESGKLLIAGQNYNGTDDDFVLIHYLANGTLDPAFGIGGVSTIQISTESDQAYSVAIQSDGKILITGRSGGAGNKDVAIARVDKNGLLDNSFGSGGVVTTDVAGYNDFGYGVAVQSDGKIVVAGASHDGSKFRLLLVRYDEFGNLDPAFGDAGIVTTAVTQYGNYGHKVIIQPDRKLVIVGESEDSVGGYGILKMVLARYNENGSLDTSFGTAGISINGISNTAQGYTALVDPNGTILLAGTDDYKFSVERVLALDSENDGNPEPWSITPFNFEFTEQDNVGLGSLQTSNLITVAGLGNNVSVPVTVYNGEYAINGSNVYISSTAFVGNGDQINVQHVSSTSHNAETQTTLEIGGILSDSNRTYVVGNTSRGVFTTRTRPSGSGGGSISVIQLVAFSLLFLIRLGTRRAGRIGSTQLWIEVPDLQDPLPEGGCMKDAP